MKQYFLLTILCSLSLVLNAQWTSTGGGNITNTNLGSVGIGTSAPTATLDVNGSFRAGNGILSEVKPSSYFSGYFRGAVNGNANIIFQGNAGNWQAFYLTAGNGVLKFGGNGGIEPAVGAINILENGNVGIGSLNPLMKLDVSGQVKILSNTNPINFTQVWSSTPDGATNVSEVSNDVGAFKQLMIVGNKSGGSVRRVGIWDQLSINGADFAQNLNINGGVYVNGSLGIGTSNPGTFKLAVEGKLGARKIIVTQTSPWPDYVFIPSYKLTPLKDLESYIQFNRHLPDVPSACDVEINGVDLGDHQAILLKKIEELTLYIIEQDKQLKTQEERNRVLELKNKAFEERFNNLERLQKQLEALLALKQPS